MSEDGTRLLSGVESAEQRLRHALAVRRGSYPWSRDYGSRLDDVVDRTMGPDLEARLFAAIAETVAHIPNGLSDVTLREVRLHQDPAHPDRAEVEVVADWTDATGHVTPIGLRQALGGTTPRSIWDPSLLTGHTSHVYTRYETPLVTVPGGSIWEVRPGWRRLQMPRRPPVAGSSAVPSPLIEEGVRAYITYLQVRTAPPPYSSYIRMYLSSSPDRGDRAPGPHIASALLGHLALALRARTETVVVRTSDVLGLTSAYSADPYQWRLDGALGIRMTAWAAPLAAGDAVDVALCYVGPGTVVDLAALTSTGLGGRPRVG